jgi:mono/diheme cytochrome c family protein
VGGGGVRRIDGNGQERPGAKRLAGDVIVILGQVLPNGMRGRVVIVMRLGLFMRRAVQAKRGEAQHEGEQRGHDGQGGEKPAHEMQLGWLDRPGKMPHAEKRAKQEASMRGGGMMVVLVALAGSAAAQEKGREIYQRYCVACHGEDGSGDGPLRLVLTLDPPDLTRLASDNGGVFPRKRVIWRIDGRDPLLAHGNEMPVYGDLFSRRDLMIRDETGEVLHIARPMADLVAYLESLQRR